MTRQYYLRVIAARDGSPAAKAGLQTGDYVRAIDGKPARDLSVFEGERMLRGTPGSKVTLTVIRGNAAEPRDFDLIRQRTPGTIVTGKLMAGDIGYVRLATFGPDVSLILQSQVSELSKAGAKRLLIDIRRTAEGQFSTRHRRGAPLRQVGHARDGRRPRPNRRRHRHAAREAGEGAERGD